MSPINLVLSHSVTGQGQGRAAWKRLSVIDTISIGSKLISPQKIFDDNYHDHLKYANAKKKYESLLSIQIFSDWLISRFLCVKKKHGTSFIFFKNAPWSSFLRAPSILYLNTILKSPFATVLVYFVSNSIPGPLLPFLPISTPIFTLENINQLTCRDFVFVWLFVFIWQFYDTVI